MYIVTVNNNTEAEAKTFSQAYQIWMEMVKDYLELPQCLTISDDQLENGQSIVLEEGIFEDSGDQSVCIAIDWDRNAKYELIVRGQTFYIPIRDIEEKCAELYEEGEPFQVLAEGEDVTEFIEW